MGVRFIPKHTFFKFVGFRGVIDDNALVVLSALIHNLAEDFEGWEHSRVVIVQAFSVCHDVLS